MTIKKYLAAALAVTFLTAGQLAQAAGLPDFTELAAKSGPAVVNIGTERKASGAARKISSGKCSAICLPALRNFLISSAAAKGAAASGRR